MSLLQRMGLGAGLLASMFTPRSVSPLSAENQLSPIEAPMLTQTKPDDHLEKFYGNHHPLIDYRSLCQKVHCYDTNAVVDAVLDDISPRILWGTEAPLLKIFLSEFEQFTTARLGSINARNQSRIVKYAISPKTSVDEAFDVLQRFNNKLTSSQKDQLLDSIQLHGSRKRYGYSDSTPAFYLRDILFMNETGQLSLSTEQLRRVAQGMVWLGNDISARYVLEHYNHLLSKRSQIQAQQQMAEGGYSRFGLEHITLADRDILATTDHIQIVVHPIYRPFFDSMRDTNMGRTLFDNLESQARYIVNAASRSDHVTTALEIHRDLEAVHHYGGHDKGSNTITLLVLPPARFLESHAKLELERDYLNNYDTQRDFGVFLQEQIPKNGRVYYVESDSTISGEIGRADLNYLDQILADDVQLTIQGGYLYQCMLMATRRFAELHRPMGINIRDSVRSQGGTKQRFLVSQNDTLSDTTWRNYESLESHYVDVADSFTRALYMLRQINPVTYLQL